MLPFKILAAVLLLLALGGCSTADLLNALAPRHGVTVHTDIAYGEGPRRKLDVYVPTADGMPKADAPVVVFFYGGGWTSGSRAIYRFMGSAMASRGVMVVIPDYRLYPEVKFPDYVGDAAQAVAWARSHVAAYGGSAKHLFVMGHSAGGQIAALLALDAQYLKAVDLSPKDLAGMIGISGPYDFLPLTNPTYKSIFGPEERWPLSQPVNFVTPGAPPMLLVSAEKDDTVWPRNTHRLSAKLRAAGDEVTAKFYGGVGHITIMGAFANQLSFLAPVRQDVLDFIFAHSQSRP
jgi:acetyl esterase/lipase